MTRRQRLEAVINGEITEELIADCKVELEKLKADAEKSLERARSSERFKETKEFEERVYEALTSEAQTVEELMGKLDFEATRQRITALCTNLLRDRRIGSTEIKVKGKGKRKAYFKI